VHGVSKWSGPCVVATALALGSIAGLPACVVHQGDGWRVNATKVPDRSSPSDAPRGVSLVVIGAPAPGSTAARVAERVAAVTAFERDRGRAVALVWTGDHVFPAGLGDGDDCVEADQAWNRPGVRNLAAVAEWVSKSSSEAAGSWAVLGRRDWACGAPGRQLGESGPTAQPYTIPDHNYVVRIWADGRNRVVSSCAGPRCEIEPPSGADAPAVDLVFVDQTPWIFPPEDESARVHGTLVNEQLTALLAALPEPGDDDVTRILVSHAAVESAGIHGQGGLRPAATVHRLHPAVRAAVAEGRVRGVLAGLDRSLQLTEDLDPAMQRVAKIWIERPVFQIVSGAAGRPDARAPLSRRQLPWNQGIGIVNAHYSTHPGLAVVRIDEDTIELELQARRLARWETATHIVPLDPGPLPRARPTPPMTPCPRCDPTQAPANR